MRINGILLKRNVFNMLLLFLRRLRNRSEQTYVLQEIDVKIVLKYVRFDSR